VYLSTPTQRLTAVRPIDHSASVPRRSAGWRAHPANSPDPAPDGEPAGRLSFTALRAIVAGLARVQRSVPPDGGDPGAARSVRLLATTFYDVWLITWPDGSGLAPHDHGGSRSVLQVVNGELLETVTENVEQQPVRHVLGPGDVTRTTPSSVHEIVNFSGSDATTIHAYSPPLADIAFFRLQGPGQVHRVRSIPVVERTPQASSRDLLFLQRGPRVQRSPRARSLANRPGLRPPPDVSVLDGRDVDGPKG
jgi:predicted metal-dependent enzyme (double-stranded beta helix superfamily)